MQDPSLMQSISDEIKNQPTNHQSDRTSFVDGHLRWHSGFPEGNSKTSLRSVASWNTYVLNGQEMLLFYQSFPTGKSRMFYKLCSQFYLCYYASIINCFHWSLRASTLQSTTVRMLDLPKHAVRWEGEMKVKVEVSVYFLGTRSSFPRHQWS